MSARALPELAKFAQSRSLSKYTTLCVCMAIGGEAVERQLDAGAAVVVAALVDTLGLHAVRHRIMDEADRLFDMSFALQM